MATINNENNTTTKNDLPDLDTTYTNTSKHINNKYIEQQVNKVLNIDRNTISTTIFPDNLDSIMADAVPIWNVLGLTEEEYLKKFLNNQ